MAGKASVFWMFESITGPDIELFRHYIEVMEEFLEAEERSYLEKARKASEHWEFQHASSEAELRNHLVPILRASIFTSLYSFLESRFNWVCLQRKGQDIRLDLKQISGKGITRARTYWTKVLRLELPEDPLWQRLQGYSLVRNCLVHRGGEVSADDTKLRGYISKNPNLGLPADVIVIHQGFCEEVLGSIEAFLHQLCALGEPW